MGILDIFYGKHEKYVALMNCKEFRVCYYDYNHMFKEQINNPNPQNSVYINQSIRFTNFISMQGLFSMLGGGFCVSLMNRLVGE